MVDPTFFRRLAPALALASTMSGSILAGLLLGTWLDARLGSAPYLTGGLALLGLVSGAMYLARRATAQAPDDRPPPPPS